MGVLAHNVMVVDPTTGMPKVFVAGSTPEDWALALIADNPGVWEDQASGEPATTDDGGSDGGSSPDGGGDEPPRTGRGSGKKAWADHAKGLGIDVPSDASRDDIVGLVDQLKG